MKFSRGVYAAALTPRDAAGAVDLEAFERELKALGRMPIKGVAVNGATGEYCLTTEEELAALLHVAKRALPGHAIFCGIGCGDLRGTLRRGRLASEAGVDALLLPLPFFFPYSQQDAVAFVHAVAGELPGNILLYNLPQFTSGYSPETVLHLLRTEEKVIGIKDSSGSLDILRAITTAGLPTTRFIGNDSALCQALEEGICDGVVSGVASALPGLMCALFQQETGSPEFAEAHKRLDLFLTKIADLPTPWGIIAASGCVGLGGGSYPLPLAPSRKEQIAALQEWFTGWHLPHEVPGVDSGAAM